MKKLLVKALEQELNLNLTTTGKLNVLWMYLKYKNDNNFPGWNAFMNMLTTSCSDFQISTINYLPFVNDAPSKYNTLYTALLNVIDKSISLGMKSCLITFDQPLYIKARDIISAKRLSDQIFIIIRLGGFHGLMSFIGSIGNGGQWNQRNT